MASWYLIPTRPIVGVWEPVITDNFWEEINRKLDSITTTLGAQDAAIQKLTDDVAQLPPQVGFLELLGEEDGVPIEILAEYSMVPL